MSILITGGLGFIGLHTAKAFLDAGHDVVCTQYSVRREPEFLADAWGKRAFIEQLDVANDDHWRVVGEKHHIDGIVHLAAPSYGPQGPREGSAGLELRGNLRGLVNLLESAQAWGVQRVSIASSIAVYNGVPAGPFGEDLTLRPIATHTTEAYKKTYEIVASYHAREVGLDYVAMRIAGIFGPVHHSRYHQITRLALAAMQGQTTDPEREVYADDGTDYCYVKDCAGAIVALQTASSLPHRVYNIGAGRVTTHAEVADAINAALPGARLSMKPGSAGRSRPNAYLDITRIGHDVGWQPQWPLERAIPDYIAWLQNNED
ncbi:MAG TPA: NAD(P)-dependent oxidoreductase [Dehalococcoidia bacterium]|nr:NAD(P)-dependent oxidoreductase [Dehalococcoidia bacterium]